MIKHKIIYPDGTEEIIEHYGMFSHSSGGFAFYTEISKSKEMYMGIDLNVNGLGRPYIFISGANVRKIIPLTECDEHDYKEHLFPSSYGHRWFKCTKCGKLKSEKGY